METWIEEIQFRVSTENVVNNREFLYFMLQNTRNEMKPECFSTNSYMDKTDVRKFATWNN